MIFEDISSNADTTYYDENFKITMYHGTWNGVTVGQVIPFRFRKSSRSTPPVINMLLNKKLEQKWGLPIRNLTYASTNKIQAKTYGKLYEIKPCGSDFRLFYAKNVYDFTIGFRLFPDDIENELYNQFDTNSKYKSLRNISKDMDYVDMFFCIVNNDKINTMEIYQRSLSEINKKISDEYGDDVGDEATDTFSIIINSIVDKVVEQYDLFEIPPHEEIKHDGEIMIYAPSGMILAE